MCPLGVQFRKYYNYVYLFVYFQVGLLCYLAHVGSFVPAVSAKVRDQRPNIDSGGGGTETMIGRKQKI